MDNDPAVGKAASLNEAKQEAGPLVVTFGEALIRLTPVRGERLRTADSLTLHVGGAEANVAACLSTLGLRGRWFGLLPDNELGYRVLRELRAVGVDVSFVSFVEGRMGLYFMDEGEGPRAGQVTYDRAGSAFARMSAGFVGRGVAGGVLSGAAAFVTCGITLALGDSVRAQTLELWEAAAGSLRVFDVNYRSSLASPERAVALAAPLMETADLVFAAERDVGTLYGSLAALRSAAPNACLVLTRGASGAAAHLPDGDVFERPALPVGVSGRIGRGDAFVAGYLAGYLTAEAGQEVAVRRGLDWGVASASVKSTWAGDLPTVRAEEVRALLAGGTGDVAR